MGCTPAQASSWLGPGVLRAPSEGTQVLELSRTVACPWGLTTQVKLSVEVEQCWAQEATAIRWICSTAQPGCFCHCHAVKGAWMHFHGQPCGITAYSKSLFSCTLIVVRHSFCNLMCVVWPLTQLRWYKWRNSKMGTSCGSKQLKWEFYPLKKICTAALPASSTKNNV